MNGSVQKARSGILRNDMESSPGQSFEGSFRKSSSVLSTGSVSGISPPREHNPTSKRAFKVLKDVARKLINLDIFTQSLESWIAEYVSAGSPNGDQSFSSLFSIDELRKLDYALEGVLFQQLCRMPCSPYSPSQSKQEKYVALEYFLHAIVDGLWRTFWHKSKPCPFFLACGRHPGSKFYTLEKAISRGRLNEVHGIALISQTGEDLQAHWDKVVEFALFRQDILLDNELKLSPSSICEALFYGIHILLARCLSKLSTVGSDSVFLLIFDSKFGGVVKLGGDLGKLELNSNNPYQSIVEWIRCHAEISITPVDRIWNKLGNANWGDLGALQVLMATFYSLVQWSGPPRRSMASLASAYSLRLQKCMVDPQLFENNQNALVPFGSQVVRQGEIEEIEESNHNPSFERRTSPLKLRQGEVLLLDDQRQGHKSFRVQDSLLWGNYFLYSAVSLDFPTELLTLYVGAHPSRLEPSWEDMSLWYQVQRQTKVLNIFKQQGISNKYLPEIVASGQLLHSGPCQKQSPEGHCDHPWCGTPILVTYPFGEPLSVIVSQDGPFSTDEAISCCRNCLAALRSAEMANVQHGDICPENIIRVTKAEGSGSKFLYMPISWGRAVLEDRDRPVINLQFSSSHALQHGKLCPSSDAESLIYLLYFVCGGTMQQQDSIESALQWRERSWAKRLIQRQLSEVSALLKAFADYVDSLCGTPYPVDYDLWLKRLTKAIDGSTDRGKMVEEFPTKLKIQYDAESSGTSGGGN